VIFFSTSKSKLPGYVLPAAFPLALLLSHSISMRIKKSVVGEKWIGVASGAAIFGVIMAIDRFPFAIDYFPPGPLRWVEPLDVLAAIVAITLGFRRRSSAGVVVSVLSLIFTLAVGLTGDASWALDLGTSARWATRVPEGVSSDYWASHTSAYKLRRSFLFGVNFYLHREVPEWNGNTGERNWVFTTPREMSDLGRMGLECPHFMAFPPVMVCEVGKSADSHRRSGQPH
jgi:4-amino-4-deoxy-L-arabinose transferase-like glycosyltransferase